MPRTSRAAARTTHPRHLYTYTRGVGFSSGNDDLFAVNALRRSFYITSVSWLTIFFPLIFLRGDAQALVLIGAGWLAAAGVVFVTPIFIWCLAELAWNRFRRKRHPTVDMLDLTPRPINLLQRYGYETIAAVDRTPDASLMVLPNMDARTLREIRRAINIWKYQRWQERGFPLGETPESMV